MNRAETLAVFTEQRCWTDADGDVRGRKALGAIAALSAVVPCTVVARSAPSEASGDVVLPDQSGAVMIPWPGGARQFVLFYYVLRTVWTTVGRHGGVVVYCPGVLGTIAGVVALVRRRRVVVIAVGSPMEALSSDVVPGIAGRIVRLAISGAMRLLCRRAAVARYVTQSALQKAYPPGPKTASFGISDVGPLDVVTPPRRRSGPSVVVLTVASLEQPYKGVADLIEAIASVRADGYDVVLRVAGTGRLLPSLEQLGAARLGRSIAFLGHLTGPDLELEYAAADCFVLPSWAEGLPRALVEAMSAGLPAVGTAVGGVTELLEPQRLVPPRHPGALASAIAELVADPDARAASGRRNGEVARALIAQALADEPAFVRAVVSCLRVS